MVFFKSRYYSFYISNDFIFFGFSQKPVENVNLVLGSFLFGFANSMFWIFAADLVVKLNRNIIEILNKKNKLGLVYFL